MTTTTLNANNTRKLINRGEITIGRYTYRLNQMSGEVLRCKTEDIGRMWIDHDGNQFDAWQVIGRA